MAGRKRIILCIAALWLLAGIGLTLAGAKMVRSEEHTSELQSQR